MFIEKYFQQCFKIGKDWKWYENLWFICSEIKQISSGWHVNCFLMV